MWDIRDTFPEIKSLRVEVEAKSVGSKIEKEYLYTAVYTLDTIERTHLCSSQYCHKGGFSIEQIITEMVLQGKKPHFEGLKGCRGNEGKLAPGYYRSCGSHWNVKVDIEYQ